MSARHTGPNKEIADSFEEVAALLEQQGANPFRVDAYRRAAYTLRSTEPVDILLEREGIDGLDRLPGIGPVLARAIRDYIRTGRIPVLDRLRGEHDPEALLASVPGIGDVWAERLHRQLGIETLPALEAAAYNGRLAALPRFGTKRLEGVRATLARRLGARRGPRSSASDYRTRHDELPPVQELLDIDHEYRERAALGELTRLTPRRFNPEGRTWLPGAT
jgi:DNA polymerase (family X)